MCDEQAYVLEWSRYCQAEDKKPSNLHTEHWTCNKWKKPTTINNTEDFRQKIPGATMEADFDLIYEHPSCGTYECEIHVRIGDIYYWKRPYHSCTIQAASLDEARDTAKQAAIKLIQKTIDLLVHQLNDLKSILGHQDNPKGVSHV